MSDLAAIKATFSDFKIIRGRKVAQYIMESPLELADDCLKKLGGVPNPHQEVWVGIARLNSESFKTWTMDSADASTREDEGTAPVQHGGEASRSSAAKPKREMTLANKIGILLKDISFTDWFCNYYNCENPKEQIYDMCSVTSLSEIVYDTGKAALWKKYFWEPYEAYLARRA